MSTQGRANKTYERKKEYCDHGAKSRNFLHIIAEYVIAADKELSHTAERKGLQDD